MSTFTNYLIVILIALIILLTFTYSTDYLKINLPYNLLFKKNIETSENYSDEYENYENDQIYENYENNQKHETFQKPSREGLRVPSKREEIRVSSKREELIVPSKMEQYPQEDINNFLIDTNFATIESENINKELFIQTDDYQMTENTNNAISNALKNI